MNNCLICQTETNNPKFCSRSCSSTYTNKLYPKRTKSITQTNCLTCNILTTNPKFCSQSCSATFNNKFCPKKVTTVFAYCLNCNKQINKRRKFCNNQCQQDFNLNQKVKNSDTVPLYSRTAKSYLTKTYGHKCSICNISDWQSKPLIMVLDHIDGNSENNNLNNLRLVCSNCDSQLPTYKCRNKGKGRHSRRTRYANGQSY